MDKMEVRSIATNPSPAESSEDLEIIYESPKDVERTTSSELTDYTEMEGLNDNEDNSDLDAEELEVQNIAKNPSPAESSEDLEIIFESPKDIERTTSSELTDYTEMEGLNDNEDNSDLDAEELEDIATNPSPAESNEDVEIIFETPKVSERPAPSFEGLNDKDSSDSDDEEIDFPSKVIRKPKKKPQVLEQIKSEYPHGDPIIDSPCRFVRIPKKARLFKSIKREYECPRGEPIVGLNEIVEIEVDPELNFFIYDCLVCQLKLSTCDIIDHLLSLKHRTEYLNVIDYPGLEVIYGDCPRVKNLVKKMCIKVQRCEGMGKPAVIKKI